MFSADSAVWVANKAVELMGSNGISPEYHLEKYLRDAKISQLGVCGYRMVWIRRRTKRDYQIWGS
ncbi:MAG: acyl-CoA/acyl-ACP dehydrogenase [Syntrophobacterales bacterium]|nr:MAG: acyl-CoA/acyl-ACP dehydrogenase [Syntrophobacterales bacterium]